MSHGTRLEAFGIVRSAWLAAAMAALLGIAGHAGAQVRGDFDGDGFDDLAIGAPGEDVVVGSSTITDAGAVNVIFGSATSLSGTRHQTWTQASTGIADTPESGDGFGNALAVGDFDNDGFADLAIGVSGEDVLVGTTTFSNAGVVHVLYGTAGVGLTASGSQLFRQGAGGLEGAAGTSDGFGGALVTGDFNHDGFDDLAIGVSGEDVGTVSGAGAVEVLYGSATGLSGIGDQLWHQDVSGILESAEISDRFGSSLAAGDFDGDGFDDLAIGIIGEELGTAPSFSGAVAVLYGTVAGLDAQGNQLWSQASPGVDGDPDTVDFFGSHLAAGDFDGDGFADLAIGVPNEDVNGVSNAGAVNVIFGTANGLSATRHQFLSQASAGAEGIPEASDVFGAALTTADFDGDGRDDLVVGVPGEDSNSGAMNVFLGSTTGLRALKFVRARVRGGAAAGDAFGTSMVTGDFDGNGIPELVVGVPKDDVQVLFASFVDAGSITVFLGGTQIRFFTQAAAGEVIEAGDRFGGSLGGHR